jgi:predicted AAA+ superfamily ATPase
MLNLTELARDADVSVNTANNWLSILQTSCQVRLLQPYHTRTTKRLVKTPKLYFLDTGFSAYLAEWSSPATLEAGAMSGAILETYVFAEMLKSWWHRGKTPQVFYYRDKEGKEIDFVFVQDQANSGDTIPIIDGISSVSPEFPNPPAVARIRRSMTTACQKRLPCQ